LIAFVPTATNISAKTYTLSSVVSSLL
jgi:hypothetical protein